MVGDAQSQSGEGSQMTATLYGPMLVGLVVEPVELPSAAQLEATQRRLDWMLARRVWRVR